MIRIPEIRLLGIPFRTEVMAGEMPGVALVHHDMHQTEDRRVPHVGPKERRTRIFSMSLCGEDQGWIRVELEPFCDRLRLEEEAASGRVSSAVEHRNGHQIQIIRHLEEERLPCLN